MLDLTGTKYAVSEPFMVIGYAESGSVVYYDDYQVVMLTVTGSCGSVGSLTALSPFPWDLNEDIATRIGGFHIKLARLP